MLVGSFGLASNIVGLFLFHGGYNIFYLRAITSIDRRLSEHGHDHGHTHGKISSSPSKSPSMQSVTDADRTPRNTSPIGIRRSRERSESYSSMYGHPAATRASMVQAAQDIAHARSPSPVRRHSRSLSRSVAHVQGATEATLTPATAETVPPTDETMPLLASDASSSASSGHSHAPGPSGGHGHSHGSMNMRALLLHVLGDALGNVGVIATGLVIWQTTWSFKYYFDPIISLVITLIIFSSALPLGMSKP